MVFSKKGIEKKMPNNPLTLRKSTTEEKLKKILQGLDLYFYSKIMLLKEAYRARKNNEYPSKEFNDFKLDWYRSKYPDEGYVGSVRFEDDESIENLRANLESGYDKVTITRDKLQTLIIGSIEVFDRHAVSSWIRYLIANNYIEQTQDRQKNRKGKLITTTNLKTKYFVNHTKLETMLATHTLPKNQTTIDKFNRATSEHQETIKGQPSSLLQPLKTP